jgi:hypothetical protein
MKNIYWILSLFALTILGSCKETIDPQTEQEKLNSIAEDYVILSLNLGKYDENYIDAYFGPKVYQEKAESQSIKLDSIRRVSKEILHELRSIQQTQYNVYRIHNLQTFLESMIKYADMLAGADTDFDTESEAFYGVKAPHFDNDYYADINRKIDSLLPKTEGNVSERYEQMKSAFIVPEHKVSDVFNLAIAEARERTKSRIELPKDEQFNVEYVKGKSWGAYNWFQGGSHSLIQVNTELPFPVNNALRLACHEGYPGHHVFHSLIEDIYVKQKSWLEYSVYPLFSPLSLISEGTANTAQYIAFPEDEAVKFEIEVLLPAAGLDTVGYRDYLAVNELLGELAPISADVARSYLDGALSRKQAVEFLTTYGCRSRKRAEMNLDFYEIYRSYIVNYAVGEDIVKNYIAHVCQGPKNTVKGRWDAFYGLISVPVMPKDLDQYVK